VSIHGPVIAIGIEMCQRESWNLTPAKTQTQKNWVQADQNNIKHEGTFPALIDKIEGFSRKNEKG